MHGLIQDDYYVKKESEKDRLRMSGGAWSINLDEINEDNVVEYEIGEEPCPECSKY